ncbi:MAG: radical SAM protein, partial [Candidatus Hodarchaeota archaeon]
MTMESFDGLPFVLSWEITLNCNLNCRHCGSSAGYTRLNELTLEESLGICDQFPDLLVQEVDFTGGEPLFRPDWWKIALRLRELNIKTKLITNGVLLVPGTISQLKEVGIARIGV